MATRTPSRTRKGKMTKVGHLVASGALARGLVRVRALGAELGSLLARRHGKSDICTHLVLK